jgi:hypothetical protein
MRDFSIVRLQSNRRADKLEIDMYENFTVTDRFTKAELHCTWKANIVAIATRHADAVDVRFDVSGRAVWIAMPCRAWTEMKARTGNVITDYLAAQIAGRYLKQAVETGYDNGREIYTMTIDEVLEQADAIVREAGHTAKLPRLPITGGTHAEEGVNDTHIPSAKLPAGYRDPRL